MNQKKARSAPTRQTSAAPAAPATVTATATATGSDPDTDHGEVKTKRGSPGRNPVKGGARRRSIPSSNDAEPRNGRAKKSCPASSPAYRSPSGNGGPVAPDDRGAGPEGWVGRTDFDDEFFKGKVQWLNGPGGALSLSCNDCGRVGPAAAQCTYCGSLRVQYWGYEPAQALQARPPGIGRRYLITAGVAIALAFGAGFAVARRSHPLSSPAAAVSLERAAQVVGDGGAGRVDPGGSPQGAAPAHDMAARTPTPTAATAPALPVLEGLSPGARSGPLQAPVIVGENDQGAVQPSMNRTNLSRVQGSGRPPARFVRPQAAPAAPLNVAPLDGPVHVPGGEMRVRPGSFTGSL